MLKFYHKFFNRLDKLKNKTLPLSGIENGNSKSAVINNNKTNAISQNDVECINIASSIAVFGLLTALGGLYKLNHHYQHNNSDFTLNNFFADPFFYLTMGGIMTTFLACLVPNCLNRKNNSVSDIELALSPVIATNNTNENFDLYPISFDDDDKKKCNNPVIHSETCLYNIVHHI